ncbi:MAG: ABC-type antimicrobial peptide transport system, permease component [Bacteroidetes bacterium]|nr:ABC-type antimicrobial peptide transport system, permease component [Bacteroidota bacterium]
MIMNLTENIRLALRAIAANKLRTALTLLIIVFGIMALIGILTATEGINQSVLSSFSEMGSNTFSIKNEGQTRHRRHRKAMVQNPVITMLQCQTFKANYKYPAVVTLSTEADGNAVLKYESKKTNPNVRIMGVDDDYLKVGGWSVMEGRNFSKTEVDNGQNVILLGKDVVAKIFPPKELVVGKMVNIGSSKYRVVGLLAPKGASQVSNDNMAMIPVMTAKRNFGDDNTSYNISVMVNNVTELNRASDEAEGVFRTVRKVRPGEDPDFDISKSDKMAQQNLSVLGNISIATIVIGILTLIGAGIGLMNIMLVSVNERTREIGVSKALGATKRVIRIQFLTESTTICVIGGVIGIIMGVLVGNILVLLLNSSFVMPWLWIVLGLTFTFVIGLAAGIYPAILASNLNPVEALRYE